MEDHSHQLLSMTWNCITAIKKKPELGLWPQGLGSNGKERRARALCDFLRRRHCMQLQTSGCKPRWMILKICERPHALSQGALKRYATEGRKWDWQTVSSTLAALDSETSRGYLWYDLQCSLRYYMSMVSQSIECGLLPASFSMIELEKLRVTMDTYSACNLSSYDDHSTKGEPQLRSHVMDNGGRPSICFNRGKEPNFSPL